jgi:transposase
MKSKKRGPKPLIGEPASKNIERLLEKNSPTEHGWLRSRWSCKLLAVELFKERVAFVSRETLRRLLHRLGFRWRSPRPIPPENDSEAQQEKKRSRLLGMCFRCSRKRALFSRTGAGSKRIPKSVCAGCAEGTNDR